jgi:hypothetical protein
MYLKKVGGPRYVSRYPGRDNYQVAFMHLAGTHGRVDCRIYHLICTFCSFYQKRLYPPDQA